MNKRQIILGWSAAVGLMDALTGVLLVVAPAGVVRLLGMEPPGKEALVYLAWIGVFVGAVGLSYVRVWMDWEGGRTVWWFTALVRGLVGLFVWVRIASGDLAVMWAVVAVADWSVAAVQVWVLRARWWEEVAE